MGYFFVTKYYKDPTTTKQQIELFGDRNLALDLPRAVISKILASVGYYRLSGYCTIFQENPDDPVVVFRTGKLNYLLEKTYGQKFSKTLRNAGSKNK